MVALSINDRLMCTGPAACRGVPHGVPDGGGVGIDTYAFQYTRWGASCPGTSRSVLRLRTDYSLFIQGSLEKTTFQNGRESILLRRGGVNLMGSTAGRWWARRRPSLVRTVRAMCQGDGGACPRRLPGDAAVPPVGQRPPAGR